MGNWWPPARHLTQEFIYGVRPQRCFNHHSTPFDINSYFRRVRLFTGGAEVVLPLPVGVPMPNVSSLPHHPQSSEFGRPRFKNQCVKKIQVIKTIFKKGWTCDRWSVGAGRVAAAAWAPDSLQLVFATTDEPVLYCLSFQVVFCFVPSHSSQYIYHFSSFLGRSRGSSPSYGPFYGYLALQVKHKENIFSS